MAHLCFDERVDDTVDDNRVMIKKSRSTERSEGSGRQRLGCFLYCRATFPSGWLIYRVNSSNAEPIAPTCAESSDSAGSDGCHATPFTHP